jgi:hypothetical protein
VFSDAPDGAAREFGAPFRILSKKDRLRDDQRYSRDRAGRNLRRTVLDADDPLAGLRRNYFHVTAGRTL